MLALCGAQGAGKDTVAAMLQEHGYVRMSFAAVLKDIVAMMFDWPRDMLEGLTPESRRWREERDSWWSEQLGADITPRRALQLVGTNVFRDHFHKDIWLLCLKRRLVSNAVITDCRFENEARMLKREFNCVLIRVERPGTVVDGETFEADITIKNDGTLDDLRAQVDQLCHGLIV